MATKTQDLRVWLDCETRSLMFDPPMTDQEFEQFCADNPDMRIESPKEGTIEVTPGTAAPTGDANAEITTQLRMWWKTHRRGRVFDSSTIFLLPDGSRRSPDAAFVGPERLHLLTRKGISPVCPNFVIELRSESDDLAPLLAKMNDWIVNGAQLAWLIDPKDRSVQVYAPDAFARVDSPRLEVAGQGPAAGFVLDLKEVWSCYEELA